MRETRPTRQSQGRPEVGQKPMHRQLGYGGFNEYMEKAGYHVYWARYSMDGKDDASDIASRLEEGYTPILASELPDDIAQSIQTKDEGKLTGAVVRRDVMAMKIPLDQWHERQRANLHKAERQINSLANNRQKLQSQLASPYSHALDPKEVDPNAGVTETIGTQALERQLRF